MKILVLGGDGFCGWPTSLYLSRGGHDVAIADNLSRRKIDAELGLRSLTPIVSPVERVAAWETASGRRLRFENIDIAENYGALLSLLLDFRPDAIVHFAEQRAAPYSMRSPAHKRYTVRNNLCATHTVLCAIVESGLDIHLVHLGTMGVYGYGISGLLTPEGYLRVVVEQNGSRKEIEILHPAYPGSVYHLTKTQDQLFFQFYNRNDGVRVTDLHQGIVWGTQTPETGLDTRLINRFDYDGDYGTVLNRFLMQAAIGYPLTVHGSGGQTRAFIHVRDTCRCIMLAIENPPAVGDRVRIFNQVTEVHRVRDLAQIVAKMTGAQITHLPNPRVEAAENELAVANDGLLKLGWEPIRLEDGLLSEVLDISKKYSFRADRSKIPCTSLWRSCPGPAAMTTALEGAIAAE